jgi:hypothetical protein
MLFMIFVFAIGVGFVTLALVRLYSPDDPDDGGSDDGPPGSGRRGPRPKPRGPEEPMWWPAFERDFRAYVSAQNARQPIKGVGSGH